MKSNYAWLLIAALVTPTFAADKSPQEQAASIKAGSKIEVTLASGEKLRGRLGAVSPESLSVLDEKQATVAPRTLPWADVQGVKNKESSKFRKAAIVTVTVFAVLVGIGLISRAAGCC